MGGAIFQKEGVKIEVTTAKVKVTTGTKEIIRKLTLKVKTKEIIQKLTLKVKTVTQK